MKPVTKKILIGVGVAAAALLSWKVFGKKPSPYEGTLIFDQLKQMAIPYVVVDDATLNSIPSGPSL